jgi:hypothetical protein
VGLPNSRYDKANWMLRITRIWEGNMLPMEVCRLVRFEGWVLAGLGPMHRVALRHFH